MPFNCVNDVRDTEHFLTVEVKAFPIAAPKTVYLFGKKKWQGPESNRLRAEVMSLAWYQPPCVID